MRARVFPSSPSGPFVLTCSSRRVRLPATWRNGADKDRGRRPATPHGPDESHAPPTERVLSCATRAVKTLSRANRYPGRTRDNRIRRLCYTDNIVYSDFPTYERRAIKRGRRNFCFLFFFFYCFYFWRFIV